MSLFSRIRRLASETAIYGLSSIVGRLIGYLLVPFYTWMFVPNELGVYVAVYAGFVFFNIIYQYGMESAYLKFASGSEGRARVAAVFSTATWTLLATSAVLSVLLVLLREPVGQLLAVSPPWRYLFFHAAGILFLDTMTVVPFAELRLLNRPLRFAAIRMAGILLNVGLNFYLIAVLKQGVEAIFLANLISSGIVLVLLLPVYAGRFRFRFDRAVWGQLVRFGMPFLPSGIGYAITEVVSRPFLGNMPRERVLALYGDRLDEGALAAEAARAAAQAGGGADALAEAARAAEAVYGNYVLGVYGTVAKLAIFMMLVSQMFRFAWQPFFLQHAEDPDARTLFARVLTLFTAIGLFVCLGVTFLMDDLVSIRLPRVGYLIEPSYWLGLPIVPLLLLAYLFQGWYYNFSAGLYIESKTQYFIHNTLLGAAITLALNVLLVPRYGMMAAALATTLAYLAMAVALYFTARRFYPVSYEWGRLAGMMGIAAGLFLAWQWLAPLQRWWAEFLLLGLFLVGLVALNVIPIHLFRRLVARG